MGNEARFGGESAAPAPRTSRINELLAVEEEERKRLLGVLDIGQLADRRARLPPGRDAVAGGERADRAPDGIDQDVAVALAPLIKAAENGRRPLARAADAHDVVAELRVRVD